MNIIIVFKPNSNIATDVVCLSNYKKSCNIYRQLARHYGTQRVQHFSNIELDKLPAYFGGYSDLPFRLEGVER